MFALPPVVDDLVKRGWVGTKSGQGFYKKDASGEILTLDPASMTYAAGAPVRLPSLDAAKAIEDPGARIKALFDGKDKVGQFLRATLAPTLLYAARVAPEVAYSIDDVDRAMQWGFGWELGPFETWDAIGIEPVLEACQRQRSATRSSATRSRAERSGREPRRRALRSACRRPEQGCSCCARRRSEPPSCGAMPAPA